MPWFARSPPRRRPPRRSVSRRGRSARALRRSAPASSGSSGGFDHRSHMAWLPASPLWYLSPMTEQESRKPIFRDHDHAERRWFFGGGLHLWKITTDDSAGAFSMFEDVLTKGKVTPLHRHGDTDEMLYILEGEIL